VVDAESLIIAEIFVMADLTNLSAEPGVYVDGAHAYVIKLGRSEYETRSDPLPKNRAIKTASMFWIPNRVNEYSAAANYDYLIFADNSLSDSIARVKSINPSVKVYLYQTSQITRTNAGGFDSYYSNAPVGYSYAGKNHPEWLYTNGASTGTYVNDPDYTNTFYARRSLSSYQDAWTQGVMIRAGLGTFDGMFIDDLEELARVPDGTAVPIVEPQVDAWEIQSFIHSAAPTLKSTGLNVIKNGAKQLLESGQGQVYMDPFWQPDNNHPASQGYTANTPSNTPDATFQEWGFFSPYTSNQRKNRYDSVYWLQCLQDMDAMGHWNTATGSRALSGSQKKMLFVNIRGSDRTEDPAYGIDGWLHFGLCSYLLAQNDWTVFSCGLASAEPTEDFYAEMDYSITRRLGAPDGHHFANVGDAYCRWRRYKPTDDGGVGGLVVVNANSTATRTYRIDIDATDESGNIVTSGTKIKLPPHTGRIFLQRQLLDVSLSVLDENVYSGQTVDINVEYHNKSSSAVTNVSVQVQVPEQMTYVTGSAEKSGGRYYPETNTVVWTVSSVIPNGTGTRTFRATVK
jgi:uncharacterized repeat protein (TIGR01451 family)